MADETKEASPPAHNFGTCCEELKDAMSGEEFEPLVTVGPDGVLCFAVGLVETEDEEPAMVEYPLFFCPFCGKSLQSADEVAAKTGDTDEA